MQEKVEEVQLRKKILLKQVPGGRLGWQAKGGQYSHYTKF